MAVDYGEDFLQRIVGVQWRAPTAPSLQDAVLGSIGFVPPFTAAGPSSTTRSKDGAKWGAGFGANTGSAASGLGCTVLGAGNTGSGSFHNTTADIGGDSERVAFGKSRDGSACFIAVKGLDVRRGTLGGDPVEFKSIATLTPASNASATVYSVSFAGGAFFISYGSLNVDTYLAVSFDGEHFMMGINAFSDVNSVANGTGYTGAPDPQPYGGNVAYDAKNKVYVTTGNYDRTYIFHYQTLFDPTDRTSDATEQNFMSSTSKDGLSWTATYDISEGWGGGGISNGIAGARAVASTVCFAKGKFWAVTGFKAQISLPTYANYIYVLTGCGVAYSVDGKLWTNMRLPNTVIEHTPDAGDTGGYASCIGFYETGGNGLDGYPNGFFVVGGIESNNQPATEQEYSKLWYSKDGQSWSYVKQDSFERHWILSGVDPGSGSKLVYL